MSILHAFDSFLSFVKKGPHRVEGPMQELKEAIERSMPEQLACFHENCQVFEQLKNSK